MIITCRRRESKLVSIDERVSLLIIEQNTFENRELSNVRNSLISISTSFENSSLFMQSIVENEKKNE